MIYAFDEFEIDSAALELRRRGSVVPLEPQVFALVLVLAQNRERMVSRDEIIEKVWDGRVVSDSALDSRVKSARQALGDDGRTQRFIRTVRGQGFRFVADAREVAPAVLANDLQRPASDEDTRPRIAVLPLRLIGDAGRYGAISDALADELISELARLRWLFVIARGSSFRFRSEAPDPAEVGKLLGVHYCLSGTVEITSSTVAVAVQLVDTRNAEVVWAERFSSGIDDIHETRANILAQLIAALEIQIPDHEARVARSRASENLDAWSTYHLGLQHMFRFNRADNAVAGTLFDRAIGLDPGFARAHAGRSFVHFQNAFLGYTPDLASQIRCARELAERGIELDPRDPFANLTMGRSYWLMGDLDASRDWIDRATLLSPSYAQGIYARAWTHALSGRGEAGRTDADLAMRLSPLDPLYYAMAATRALSHIACGEAGDAARWAERAARSPGAHVLIARIAAAAHALDGDRERAAGWAAIVRERSPQSTAADFFRSFPFTDARVRERIAGAFAAYGL